MVAFGLGDCAIANLLSICSGIALEAKRSSERRETVIPAPPGDSNCMTRRLAIRIATSSMIESNRTRCRHEGRVAEQLLARTLIAAQRDHGVHLNRPPRRKVRGECGCTPE